MNLKKPVAFPPNKFLSLVCNKLRLVLLLTGVALAAVLCPCQASSGAGTEMLKQKSAAFKVVVFGDAVTAGTSAKLDLFHDCFQYGTTTINKVRPTQTWWAILERILTDWVEGGVTVVNAGLVGDTAAQAVARIKNDVLSHSPNYVLVMFSTEDALAGVKMDSFRESLETIVTEITTGNAQPILMTPPPISTRMTVQGCSPDELRRRQTHLSGLVQTIRSLAKEKSLPLIDIHQSFLDNRLAYDHLFEGWLPDAVAQTALAPFIAGELLPILGVNNYPALTVCDFRKVFSEAGHPETRHNAFTDLAYFNGEFFITFRKGHGHGVPKHTTPKSEVIVVLRSPDGINWREDAILKEAGLDNRDPKFCLVNGRLFVYAPCTGTSDRPDHPRHVTYGFERLESGKWSEPFACAPCVLWRPRKWRGQYVAAGYVWKKKDSAVKLLSSEDGRDWKVISDILPFETKGNETDLWVDNDRLTAFSRAASELDLLISTYFPEENRWETVSSGRIIHAPNLFKAGEQLMISGRYMSYSDERFRDLQKDWRWFTSGKASEEEKADQRRVEEYHHGLRTGLFLMDGTTPRLLMEFLSAGDCSYTGVVQYGNEYLISDYSMHEYYRPIKRPGDWNTPSDIYVWRLRFR